MRRLNEPTQARASSSSSCLQLVSLVACAHLSKWIQLLRRIQSWVGPAEVDRQIRWRRAAGGRWELAAQGFLSDTLNLISNDTRAPFFLVDNTSSLAVLGCLPPANHARVQTARSRDRGDGTERKPKSNRKEHGREKMETSEENAVWSTATMVERVLRPDSVAWPPEHDPVEPVEFEVDPYLAKFSE